MDEPQRLSGIPYPLRAVDLQGRVWHPYEVKFHSPDGAYVVHLYAISEDHARLQLDALKETGYVVPGVPIDIYESGK